MNPTVASRSRLSRWHLLGGLIAAVSWGCDGDAGDVGPLLRDSAGITIVENTGPVWAPGEEWWVPAEPTLDIGIMDGDSAYQLFRVTGAVRQPDGGIAVANSGTGEIRFFDRNGVFRKATGRRGGGPGEFEMLMWLLPTRGDSLLAYDWRHRRVSVLSGEGEYARSFQLEMLTTSGGFPVVSEAFPDGHLLLATEMTFASGEIPMGARRDSAVYYVLDPDGEVAESLGAFPGGESYHVSDGETWYAGALSFGRFGQAAVGALGFYYGSSDRYEITFFDRSRNPQRILRLERENLEVTQEDIDRYVENRLARADTDEERHTVRTLLERMPFPSTMPAHGSLVVDKAGNLWVEEYRRPGDRQPRWRVFDGDGILLGTVETPERYRIFEIGPDYLLGRWDDDLDVEHIRLHPLVKDPV